MRVLGIDPGNLLSGFVIAEDYKPVLFDKLDNQDMLDLLAEEEPFDAIGLEMIAPMGMTVGATVMDTAFWVGKIHESLIRDGHLAPTLVTRATVKLHHTRSPRATDAVISRALKDRFAYGVRNHGKGTKSEPGFFYGFRADVWQAYAVAVWVADVVLGVQHTSAGIAV